MKTLTLKLFIKDLLLQAFILSILALLFFFMQTGRSPFATSLLWELLGALPIILFGLVYCILFYYLFFRSMLADKQFKKSFLVLFVLIPAFFIGDRLFLSVIVSIREGVWNISWFDKSTVFRFILFTGYAIPYSFIKGFAWMREQKIISEKDQISASLQNLRSQIEPHFIFNSLNNLYGLAIEEKAPKTSDSIVELSALFRYTLKESNVERIPVKQELDFIEKYIHLQRLRISESEKFRLNVNISWDKKPAEIAPLLLINFIENAFKYGISLQENSFIDIDIKVAINNLHLTVQNAIHKNNNLQNGYGLENARKRLELLYKGKYTLEEKSDDIVYKVILTINLL